VIAACILNRERFEFKNYTVDYSLNACSLQVMYQQL
jgi:hypothetical protein